MTHDPIDEQKDLETLVAAIRRWQIAPRINLPLKPYEGWVTIAGIQRCLQHPELPPDLRTVLTRVGRRLQPLVCGTPEINDLVERGWDASYDQPADPAPGNLGLPPEEPVVAPQVDPRPETAVDRWRRLVIPVTVLSYRDKLVAMVLAVLANPRTLEVDTDLTQLAAQTDMSTAAVRAALARLADLNLITDLTEPGAGPGTCYRLTIPQPRNRRDHVGSVLTCVHPECGFESTCGDCIDGKCHGSGPCGCARHEASVLARQRHEGLNGPEREPR